MPSLFRSCERIFRACFLLCFWCVTLLCLLTRPASAGWWIITHACTGSLQGNSTSGTNYPDSVSFPHYSVGASGTLQKESGYEFPPYPPAFSPPFDLSQLPYYVAQTVNNRDAITLHMRCGTGGGVAYINNDVDYYANGTSSLQCSNATITFTLTYHSYDPVADPAPSFVWINYRRYAAISSAADISLDYSHYYFLPDTAAIATAQSQGTLTFDSQLLQLKNIFLELEKNQTSSTFPSTSDADAKSASDQTDQSIMLPVSNGVATKTFNLSFNFSSNFNIDSDSWGSNYVGASAKGDVSLDISVPPQKITITDTTPANSSPIRWDPHYATNYPLSVTVHSTQMGKVDIQLYIYDAKNNIVKSISQNNKTLNESGNTVFPLEWDGSTDAGTKASQGLYRFRFHVAASEDVMDYDDDKSKHLSISSNEGYNVFYDHYDAASKMAYFKVAYILSDDLNSDASTGKIELYNPGSSVNNSVTLNPADLTRGAGHEKLIGVSEPSFRFWGKYTFLVSMQDNDAANNKSGSKRWAMPLCLTVPFKQVYLTDPVDNVTDPITNMSGPMLFRGKSESDQPTTFDETDGLPHRMFPNTSTTVTATETGTGNIEVNPPLAIKPAPKGQTTACPIVVRGTVPVIGSPGEHPLLVFSFEKSYNDANGKWVKPQADEYYAEKSINPAQLGSVTLGAYDPSKGYPFQVVWNQMLDRTKTPVDNNRSPKNPERFVIRAYAIYNEPAPVSADSTKLNSQTDKQLRAMAMAAPLGGAITNGYADVGQLQAGYRWIFQKYSQNNQDYTFTLPIYDQSVHLGLDFGAKARSDINASEFGKIDDTASSVFVPAPQKAIDDQTLSKIIQDVNNWLAGNMFPALNQPNAPLNTGYPWVDVNKAPVAGINLLRVDLVGGTRDDSQKLGPNRSVRHGLVNLRLSKNFLATLSDPMLPAVLSKDIYDQDEVISDYCHVQTQVDGMSPLNPLSANPAIADGKLVDISTPIANVGDYAAPLVPANINDVVANGYDISSNLLSRGYFEYDNVKITITSISNNQLIGTYQISKLYVPSLDGPHLHYEVHLPKEVNKVMLHDTGQQDPTQWLILFFGHSK